TYTKAVLDNKCPHVKLYKQWRRAQNDDLRMSLYKSLAKFLSAANAANATPKGKQLVTKMIACNNCGFDIICPHMYITAQAEANRTPQREIKALLTPYINRRHSEEYESVQSYYCKICGESIAALDFEDVDLDSAAFMNEDLRTFMWSEVGALMKYLRFGSLVAVPRLITYIRDMCYPYIFDVEKQILKSKTNTQDEIKAKKRL